MKLVTYNSVTFNALTVTIVQFPLTHLRPFSAKIYLFKVNNRNTRKRHEICSNLTLKTPERRQWRRSGVFIVNFGHISHLFLVFLLLTLNKQMLAGLFIETAEKRNCHQRYPKN